jgi:hypothetical protein
LRDSNILILNVAISQVPVAHTCNPSYSGGLQFKVNLKNSLQDHILKNASQKKRKRKNRAGGVTQGEGPEFKPQYQKKKKCCNQ